MENEEEICVIIEDEEEICFCYENDVENKLIFTCPQCSKTMHESCVREAILTKIIAKCERCFACPYCRFSLHNEYIIERHITRDQAINLLEGGRPKQALFWLYVSTFFTLTLHNVFTYFIFAHYDGDAGLIIYLKNTYILIGIPQIIVAVSVLLTMAALHIHARNTNFWKSIIYNTMLGLMYYVMFMLIGVIILLMKHQMFGLCIFMIILNVFNLLFSLNVRFIYKKEISFCTV